MLTLAFQLVATMVTEDPQYSSALVVQGSEEKPVALSVGDELAGMEVVSIETDRIELKEGNRREELLLQPR